MIDVKRLVTARIPEVLQEFSTQSNRSPLSPKRCMEALNDAYRLMSRRAEQVGKSDLLEYVNMRVADQRTGLLDKRIPMRVSNRISLAVASNGEEVPSSRERNATHYKAFYGIPSRDAGEINYTVRRDQVFVLDRSSSHYRLWFTAKTPPLHYGLVHASQVSSLNTLNLNPIPENGAYDWTRGIYLNQLIFIYEGAGAGQTARIINQAGSTATLGPVDDAETALETPIDATSHYCIVPWFGDFTETMVRLAGMQFTKMDTALTLQGEAQAGMAQYIDWLTPEDLASQVPIPNQGSDDFGLNAGGWD